MDFNFNLNDKATKKSLEILRNQCWKTLPIYEGKNKDDKIIYSRDEAFNNYQKHLTFLVTKITGASKLWQDNQYYVELLYILEGMKDYTSDNHEQVRLMIFHCLNLIEKMKEMVLGDA
jgi:hypothetical protein